MPKRIFDSVPVTVKQTLILLVALVLTLVPLSGCTEQKTETVHLKVAVLPYITFATFFIAQDEGYFAEQGLDVEFVKFNSIVQAMPLLAQGSLDAAGGPVSASFFNAIGQDMNVKIVAGKEYSATEGPRASLMVRRDLYDSGEVDTIAEMKGRQVAITALGNIQHFQLSKILETAGLTLNDVTIVKLGPADIMAAFENKSIETALVSGHYHTLVETAGYAVRLQSFESIIPEYQIGYILFGPSLLEGNQEVGKKFMVAYLKGARLFAEGKTERVLNILENYLGVDRETLTKEEWNKVRPDGWIPVNDILIFQDWAYENGLLDKKIPAEQLIDTAFVDYANEILGPAT